MQQIKKYLVYLLGGPETDLSRRAQIMLYASNGKLIANIWFMDPQMPMQNDYQASNGYIRMQLPASMLKATVDILRNEEPIYIYFRNGRAFLTTSKEPIGEEED